MICDEDKFGGQIERDGVVIGVFDDVLLDFVL